MKKVFLLGLSACSMLGAISISAQTASPVAIMARGANSNVQITTANDSISYAYGLAMTQGLSDYLVQMGMLLNSNEVEAEYNYRIGMADDDSQKAALSSEMKTKVDSINKANEGRMAAFATGFSETFNADDSKAAYYGGISIASQVKTNVSGFAENMYATPEEFNRDLFVAAFMSNLKGEKPLIDVENPNDMLQARGEEIQKLKEKQQEEALKAEYKDQIAANEKFLVTNKKKKGVKTLPSGLQYKVVTKGTGAIPTKEDIVKVHYKGTLIDGTEFDSSYERGEPTSFSAGHVITGWTEALTMMPVGSKWLLYIPQDLAYGARDQGTIKPFSTLIFEVELLEFVSAEEAEKMMSSEEDAE